MSVDLDYCASNKAHFINPIDSSHLMWPIGTVEFDKAVREVLPERWQYLENGVVRIPPRTARKEKLCFKDALQARVLRFPVVMSYQGYRKNGDVVFRLYFTAHDLSLISGNAEAIKILKSCGEVLFSHFDVIGVSDHHFEIAMLSGTTSATREKFMRCLRGGLVKCFRN